MNKGVSLPTVITLYSSSKGLSNFVFFVDTKNSNFGLRLLDGFGDTIGAVDGAEDSPVGGTSTMGSARGAVADSVDSMVVLL